MAACCQSGRRMETVRSQMPVRRLGGAGTGTAIGGKGKAGWPRRVAQRRRCLREGRWGLYPTIYE